MALIPVYFTVAEFFKFDNSSSTAVAAGTVMKVTADAALETFVVPAGNTGNAVGLAGDGYKTDGLTAFAAAGANPGNSGATRAGSYAADIVINAQGNTVRTTNRVYELYKETLGSGRMTIYSGSGKFLSTEYETGVTYAIGDKLYSSAAGKVTNASNTNAAPLVGTLVGLPKAYPNGVPGISVEGSMSLGNYMAINLLL